MNDVWVDCRVVSVYDMGIDSVYDVARPQEGERMTLYVWECKCCHTRYVEGFSRVSNPHVGMEFKIPCPYGCREHPGVSNVSVMVLKEIKGRVKE